MLTGELKSLCAASTHRVIGPVRPRPLAADSDIPNVGGASPGWAGMKRFGVVIVCLGVLTAGVLALVLPRRGGPPAPPPPPAGETGPVWFEDITDAAGIDFVHDPGPAGTYFMPQ